MYGFRDHTDENTDVSFYQRKCSSIPTLDHNRTSEISSGIVEWRSQCDSCSWQLTSNGLIFQLDLHTLADCGKLL